MNVQPDDTLEWISPEGSPHHRARNHADTGTYFAFLDTNWKRHEFGAAFERDTNPWQMGSPSDIYRVPVDEGSMEDAKRAAQEHHNAACRAARWAAYMRDNEPPQ